MRDRDDPLRSPARHRVGARRPSACCEPMPDYRCCSVPRDAKIVEKLETLVISTPSPRESARDHARRHTRSSDARTCATAPRRDDARHVVDREGRPARQAHRQDVIGRQARVPVAVPRLVPARAARRSRQPDHAGARRSRCDRGDGQAARRGSPAIRTIEAESGENRRPCARRHDRARRQARRSQGQRLRPRHQRAADARSPLARDGAR